MAQSDIDKILEELKRRKGAARETGHAAEDSVKTAVSTPQPEKPEEPEKNTGISDQGKEALRRFMNNTAGHDDPVDDKLDAQFPESAYVSKKSEDYLDENFMKFFTQSVVVTQSAEKTNNLRVKRRKGGLFRKKYITDSLSLNIEQLEEDKVPVMPVVKTASDVRQENWKRARAEREAALKKQRREEERRRLRREKQRQEKLEQEKMRLEMQRQEQLKAREEAQRLARMQEEQDRLRRKERIEKASAEARLLKEQKEAREKARRERAAAERQRIEEEKARLRREQAESVIEKPQPVSKADDADSIARRILRRRRSRGYTGRVSRRQQSRQILFEPEVRQTEAEPEETVQPQRPVQAVVSEDTTVQFKKATPQREVISEEVIRAEIQRQKETPAEDDNSQDFRQLSFTDEGDITEPVKEESAGPRERIVENIYTQIIETRARDALAEDATAFVMREETEEKTEVLAEGERPTEVARGLGFVPVQDEEEQEEVFEEYISNSEFFSKPEEESGDLLSELLEFRQTLSLRMVLGAVCAAILIYFGTAAKTGLPMPAFISPDSQPLMYFIACTVIYGIAFIGFLPTVISGFTALKRAPAPDSLLSLGAVLGLVQPAVSAIFSKNVSPSQFTLFSGFICIALAFNAMGKKIATSTIIKNLSLANVPDGINAGYIINDNDSVKRLARSLDEKIPKILVSRKTGSITNFIKAGFSIHPGDYKAKQIALISYAVTFLCFVLGTIISKDFVTGLFSAVGAAALQMPLASTLVSSVPDALMQKNLEKVGALVNGRQGIDQLSKTTHVNFDARHLFPRGTVVLHGIKTFEKERIDLAIIYAASVLIEKCQVLRPVFMDVIDGKTDILYPVENCEYIELAGYVSWINNTRVIIGNRTLMEKYDVDMPPLTIEARFVKQGRKPVYLAVGGKLFGMFVFSYRPDEIVKENIDKLLDKGVNIILSSDDFNIDPALVEQVYHIPGDCVTVLNRKEAELLRSYTDYAPETEACLAHLDSLPSLVAGFCGAESAENAEKVCSTIRSISVILGAVLALVFTYFGTIAFLPLMSVVLLSLGFMSLTMIAAFVKKY